MAHVEFISWVNVFRLADVDNDRHPRFWFVQCECLSFTQLRPFAFAGSIFNGLEVCQLHVIEREVTLTPRSAPIANHRWEESPVLVCTSCVAFSLVPDRTTNRQRCERCDHGVVENAGTVLISWAGGFGTRTPIGTFWSHCQLDFVIPR